MKKTNGIVFTQAQDSTKAVVSDRYVVHPLFVKNEAIVQKLGGKVIRGVGGFRAEFPKVASAKEFVKTAITEMSEKEYNSTRKVKEFKPVEEGNKKPKTSTKGNKKSTCKGKGNNTPTKSATKVKETKTPTKGKGNVELTEVGKKTLDRMKMSILNRAASAYSIANGGGATTFSALGKSEKELKEFIPNAKVGLLKSSKWAKAVSTYGLTEDMLG